jgi:hypothetical protein
MTDATKTKVGLALKTLLDTARPICDRGGKYSSLTTCSSLQLDSNGNRREEYGICLGPSLRGLVLALNVLVKAMELRSFGEFGGLLTQFADLKANLVRGSRITYGVYGLP